MATRQNPKAAFGGSSTASEIIIHLNRCLVPQLFLLLAGGLSYTVSISFYLLRKLSYHHAIWHLFVLTGSIFHFFAVLFYVIPVADL